MKQRNYLRISQFILLLVFAVAMAIATFVENSQGTPEARRLFYESPWFIGVECLLALNFIALVVREKMLLRRQWGGLIFHLAFVVILLGAGITHFFSYEGVLHVREGDRVNYMYLNNGQERLILPFEVFLKDFRLERYPGSHSPASYESLVTISVDGQEKEHRIYMNNVVDVKGYRLFQSSYDQDERGTVLTVNYDRAGMLVSYFGYVLLVLGMLLTFFGRNSRFRRLMSELKGLRNAAVCCLCFICLLSGTVSAENGINGLPTVDAAHAERFGKLVVQNPKGRLEPVNTWTSKIVRKLYQENSIGAISADQFFLNLLVYPEEWGKAELIKVKNPELMQRLNRKGEYAAFYDFFGPDGAYRLAAEVERVYEKKANERNRTENDLLKLDEAVNILWQIREGKMLALFPLEGDPHHKWYSAGDDLSVFVGKDSMFVSKIMVWYMDELVSKNMAQADQIVEMIATYQTAKNKTIPVDVDRIEAEIYYNKAGVFSAVFKYYLIFGGLLLVVVLWGLVQRKRWLRIVEILLTMGIVFAFLWHTFGLGLRWYISGYAPWTNSYESMVYVAWAVVFGGLWFVWRTRAIVALASLLTGVLLFVSSLNQMNPEITPLVPVLQSYWLMLHVAVIMAGYGFFFICALIGLFNMVLMIVERGRSVVAHTIKELTILNEMAMILGLMLMTIGTFLGAVWANESWGRYWGWDPKETWALISVVVYAVVLHLRFIPGWKSSYLYNLLSVLSIASVLMTYFGVNYYLSGMHSYGKTDAQLLPWPFILVGVIIAVIAIVAGFRKK